MMSIFNQPQKDGFNFMTTSNQSSNADSIIKELNKSDLGHLVVEYRNVVLALLVLFVVGAFSYAGWVSWKNDRHQKERSLILTFQQKYLTPATEKKLGAAALWPAFQELASKMSSGNVLMDQTRELVIIARQNLAEAGSLVPIFMSLQSTCKKSEFCYFHYGVSAAVLMEDLGQHEQALTVYQSLIGSPFAIEDKLYFDLSRSANSAGKKDLLKTYLEYLRKNHASSNYGATGHSLG